MYFYLVFAFVFVYLGAVLVNLGNKVVAHGCLVHSVLLNPKFATIPMVKRRMMMMMMKIMMMMMMNIVMMLVIIKTVPS